VVVDLSLTGGILSLEISDNGCGLSSSDLAKTRSFGIRGLHERASTVGGWVDLSSGGAGTSLILSVPLDPAAALAETGENRGYHGDAGQPGYRDEPNDSEAQAWATR
jgi:signal transduction histidine kinase